MAKLFVSYAREDRQIVEALDAALSQDGHAIWWDRELATGAGAFRPQIQEALDAADLVLVLWTERSRVSRYVADEADIALSRGRLLSLLVDGARPALGFGAIHGVDLTGWTGLDDEEGLQPLRQEIERRLAKGLQPASQRPTARVLGATFGLCVATAITFGVMQGSIASSESLSQAVQLGLEHAAYALLLSLPAGAFAATRSRQFGLSRWRAVSRPFLRTLLLSFIVAVVLVALAMAAGVDAEMPRGARVRQMASVALFATLAIAAIIGGLRLLLLLNRR